MFPTSVKLVTSSVIRKALPAQYCACQKSTATSQELIDNVKSFKDMPGPSGMYTLPKVGIGFFFKPFGNFTVNTMHKLLDHLHGKYGKTFRTEVFGPTVVTAEADVIETLLRNEGKYPRRNSITLIDTYAQRNKVDKGMAILNGEEWHRLRSATQKYMLKSNSASIYIDAQVGVARDLITRMSTMSYTPAEFREELFKFATESIGVVCFNKRLGFMDPKTRELDPESAEYLQSINLFFELLMTEIGPPLYKIFPTKTYKDFERVANNAYGYGRARIQETLDRAEKEIKDRTFDPEEPNLILQLMRNPKTTVSSANAILLDLLTGGTDSTAKNMELFLRTLALNPDKQEKLYEEIVKVVGVKGHEMKMEHMAKMVYFRACLKEQFRLVSPVIINLRILPTDEIIDGYLVPKGTTIFANSRYICLSSRYFPEPETYRPERWIRDEVTHKRDDDIHPFALQPFGFGVRNCLGRRFAEQELWLGITKIIQNFKVSVPDSDENKEVIYTTFGQAPSPIDFTFTPR